MQFAWYSHFAWRDQTLQSQVIAQLTEEIQLAEALGFTTAWVAEHHFSHYGLLSSPLVLLSNIAAKTTTIRLGIAVIVLPLHNPIRLAEDIAMLDRVSNGRVSVGLGRGTGAFEYAGFNLDRNEDLPRVQEALAVVEGLFTTPEFSFAGRYFTVNNVTLVPSPVQKPHPPIYIAASGSPATLEFITASGHPALIGFTPETDHALEVCRRFAEKSAAAGHNVPVSALPFFRHMYVAETEEQARNDTRDSIEWMLDVNQWRGTFRVGGDAMHSLDSWRQTRVQSRPTYEQVAEKRAFFGTPGTIIPRIRALQREGIEIVGCNFQFGGMDHARVMRSMELFAKEVMPEFV